MKKHTHWLIFALSLSLSSFSYAGTINKMPPQQQPNQSNQPHQQEPHAQPISQKMATMPTANNETEEEQVHPLQDNDYMGNSKSANKVSKYENDSNVPQSNTSHMVTHY